MNGIAVEKIIVGISLLSLSSILQITNLALKLMSSRHAYQGETLNDNLRIQLISLFAEKIYVKRARKYSTRTHVSTLQRHSVV